MTGHDFNARGSIPGTASEYFGAMIESYDSLIRRAVPRYAEMTDRLLMYLPEIPAQAETPRILELGCGTGNLSLRLAERLPRAAITLVDGAPEMIDLTRARMEQAFPSSAQRATFTVARFEEVRFEAQSFDLATSCISLHHVRDKAALYRRVFSALKPGARFCFADQIAGGGKFNHDLNWRLWLEFCRQQGHCTEDEIRSLLEHAAAHDHYTPLAEHFHLLSAAGLVNIDCVWRNLIWGIVTADRANQKGV